MTHFNGKAISNSSNNNCKGLVIEVDGVFHFARNSEESLGRDVIKFKVLKKLGYHPESFGVPYFAWAILEGS